MYLLGKRNEVLTTNVVRYLFSGNSPRLNIRPFPITYTNTPDLVYGIKRPTGQERIDSDSVYIEYNIQ